MWDSNAGENRDNKIKHYDYQRTYYRSVEQSLKNLKLFRCIFCYRPRPLMQSDEIAEALEN
jgi:predicted oxidoreductase